jgi:hypothetical protein
MSGWIKLHRQLIEHDLWTQEPFTRGQAWVDLLMLANHAKGQLRVRGNLILVERGEVARSEDSLAQRWKWSRNKVRRFIAELSEKPIQQIEQQKSPILSKIRIIKYDFYQSNGSSETTDDTTERQQKDTNKKNKEENEEKKGKETKKIHAKAFTPPTWDELRAYMVELADESGKPKSPMPKYYRYKPEELSFFFSYYHGNGWTTKDGKPIASWKGKLLTWIKIWLDKNPPQIIEGL